MPSVDELFEVAEAEVNETETNGIIEINADTRTMMIPETERVFGVMSDEKGERKYFRCKRFVGNGIDLSKLSLRVIFQNASGLETGKDKYIVTDLATDGEGHVTFSWELSRKVTAYKGIISFIVCAIKTNTDGTITNEWNTTLANGLVLDGLEVNGTQEQEEVAKDYYNQLEAELLRVANEQKKELENIAGNAPYKGKTIVAFGDSIIAGWGWKEGTGIIQPLKEKYADATWINKAESGANMAVTSSSEHTPIVTQIRNYNGTADAILFDGGVNDTNNSIPIGSIESGYDASYNTGTFCGAMESSLQYIMDRYPLAVKLYIIPHSFAKDNSYVDSIYLKAIEICEKWNMPYLDMRKYSQIAMTAKNKSKYTKNANSGVGDGVHPVESWYRTFYSPVIDQKLRSLGIGYATASVAPTVIPVIGVSLNENTLSIKKGESAILTATVKPSNATNQSVKWSTSNSNVTVSNGKVTGKDVGTSVVTVTTDDGGYTAQCTVNVAENTVEPSESHTEVKGLLLDGNCYFDTEILPTEKTNTEAKLYVKNGSTYLVGARDNNYKYGYTVTDNFYAVRGTVSSAAKSAEFWQDSWIIKQNGSTFTFGSNSVNTDSIDSFKLTSPFYIGNMSQNGKAAGVGLSGIILYFKIFDTSTLVADIVPVKKSDGTLCLYDKVRKKYIYNSGSGTVKEFV